MLLSILLSIRNTTLLISASLIIISPSLTSCETHTQPAKTQPVTVTRTDANVIQLTPSQSKRIKLQIRPAEKRNLSQQIPVNGTVKLHPQSSITITALTEGVIEHIALTVGMKVQAGSVCATLKHPDLLTLQEDYLKTKANLQLAEQERQRQQILQTEQAGALKKLQEAETNLQILHSTLTALTAKFNLLNLPLPTPNQPLRQSLAILTPQTGLVSEVAVNQGQYIPIGAKIATLINPQGKYIELQVFESIFDKLKIGQSVQFTTSNLKLTGTVTALIPILNENTRTFSLIVQVPNSEQLIPGQYLQGFLDLGTTLTEVIPESAVIFEQQQAYVYQPIQSPDSFNLFQKLPIKVGKLIDGFYPLIEPISSPIVTQGAYYLMALEKNSPED